MKKISTIAMFLVLILSAFGVATAQDDPLTGTWLWLNYTDEAGVLQNVNAPASYTITFEAGDVSIVADCKNATGIYTVSGSSLEIFLGPSAGIFCGEESLSDLFLMRLNAVTSFAVNGDGSVTMTTADGGTLGFIPQAVPEQPIEPTSVPTDVPTEEPTAIPPTAVPPTPENPIESTPEPENPIEQPPTQGAWNGTWYMRNFQSGDGSTIVAPVGQTYAITLNADGTIAVQADCNTSSGIYNVSGASMTISLGATTAMACAEDSLSSQFIDWLNQSASFVFGNDGSLNIALMMDSGILKFRNFPVPPVTGLWYWVDFRGGDGSVLVANPSQAYAVDFREDATVGVRADCNEAQGTYSADASSISINLGPMTAVACAEGSLSNQFVDLLVQANSYVFAQDGSLNLALPADAGIIKLASEPAFIPTDPTEIPEYTTWYWSQFQPQQGPVEIVELPDAYRLILADNGDLAVQADCNTVQGSYTMEGSLLRLEMGPMTRAMCPEDSRSDQFLSLLGQTDTFVVDEDGKLQVALELGAGLMTFVDSSELILGSWQWSQAHNNDRSVTMEMDQPTDYTVTFDDEGMVFVKGDCNNAQGEYTIDGETISIVLGPMTMAMCPEGSQSDLFFNALGVAEAVSFERGNLELALPTNDVANGDTLEFTPGLVGTEWAWIETITPMESIEVSAPEKYMMTLNDDGTVNIKADCNVANAVYAITGTGISISVGPMTMAMCPEGSLSDTFVQQVNSSAIYFFMDGYLYIDLFADSGTMKFINSNKLPVEGVVGTWQLTDYRQANVTSGVADSSLYVVDFGDDGSASVTSDCKSTEGTYTAEDGMITVELGPTTMEICPDEGSLGDLFISWLSGAQTYTFEEGRLKIELTPEMDGTLWLSQQ